MTLLALLILALAQTPAPAPTTGAEMLTAAHLDKLKSITLGGSKAANLDAPVANMLGLAKAGEPISVKQFKADTTVGLYVLTIPVKPATDDVVFSFRDLSGVTYNYLSDSTRVLRAAMSADADGSRMLTNAEAAEGFQNSLRAWDLIAGRVKAP